jgi:hypothetical protein
MLTRLRPKRSSKRRAARWFKDHPGGVLIATGGWAGLLEAPRAVSGALLLGGFAMDGTLYARKRLSCPPTDPFGNPPEDSVADQAPPLS